MNEIPSGRNPPHGGRMDGFDFIREADFICNADFILAQARISLSYENGGIAVAENKLADLSTAFSVNILKLTESVKGHSSVMNQLERSATSIGANIREAKYAHSRSDFIAKLQISLKECYETEYWLELIEKAELLPSDRVSGVFHDCGVIRRMLIASINTAKENKS